MCSRLTGHLKIRGPASRRLLEAPGAEKLEGALYAEDVRSKVLVSGKSKRNSGLRTELAAF
jgi:hypothetical protein